MKIRILFFPLLLSLGAQAQKFLGLWEIVKVEVGSQEMTPQSKWIEFDSLGFKGGNGLLQNSAGLYTWDSESRSLSLNDTLGFEDPFEAFRVSWQGDTMIWQREEEGAAVKVICLSADVIPKRMSDAAVGIWIPRESGDSLSYLFLRWDRIYIEQYKDGRRFTGVWQAHAHRPELIFLPWDRNVKPRSYRIESGLWEELILQSNDDSSQSRQVYYRTRSIPN